jgi:hypothetical protein
MKIISKYKDYYDYLVGIYGVDEKLILDRTDFVLTSKLTNKSKVTFYICGYIIDGYYIDGKFYYGSDLEQFADEPSKWRWLNDNDLYYIKDDQFRYRTLNFYKVPTLDKDNINETMNCPILIVDSKSSESKISFSKFPILKDYDVVSIFPPEKLWTMIYDFLSKNKDIENKQSDKEKIISKGFDYKHSFRNTK